MSLYDSLSAITPEQSIEAIDAVAARLHEGQDPEGDAIAQMLLNDFKGLAAMVIDIMNDADNDPSLSERDARILEVGASMVITGLVEIAQREKLKGIVGDPQPPSLD